MRGIMINRLTRLGFVLLVLFFIFLLGFSKVVIASICGIGAIYFIAATNFGEDSERKYREIEKNDFSEGYLNRKARDSRRTFCEREAYRYAAKEKKKSRK